jgi:hypothetical protein
MGIVVVAAIVMPEVLELLGTIAWPLVLILILMLAALVGLLLAAILRWGQAYELSIEP